MNDTTINDICIIKIYDIYYVKRCSTIYKFFKTHNIKDCKIYYPITKRLEDENIYKWEKRESLMRIFFHGLFSVYSCYYQRCYADVKIMDKVYDEICNLFD